MKMATALESTTFFNYKVETLNITFDLPNLKNKLSQEYHFISSSNNLDKPNKINIAFYYIILVLIFSYIYIYIYILQTEY